LFVQTSTTFLQTSARIFGKRLWEFYLYPISVLELILITQPDIRGDLDDVPRVMSCSLFVLIRTEQESLAVKNLARHNVHGYGSSVLVRFEAHDILWKRIRSRQFDIERSWIQSHTRLLRVERIQAFDPESKTREPTDHPASKPRHALKITKPCPSGRRQRLKSRRCADWQVPWRRDGKGNRGA